MPASYNSEALKSQIAAAADDLRALLNEAGHPQPGVPFITSRELDAAFTAMDATVAHAIDHIRRNWF